MPCFVIEEALFSVENYTIADEIGTDDPDLKCWRLLREKHDGTREEIHLFITNPLGNHPHRAWLNLPRSHFALIGGKVGIRKTCDQPFLDLWIENGSLPPDGHEAAKKVLAQMTKFMTEEPVRLKHGTLEEFHQILSAISELFQAEFNVTAAPSPYLNPDISIGYHQNWPKPILNHVLSWYQPSGLAPSQKTNLNDRKPIKLGLYRPGTISAHDLLERMARLIDFIEMMDHAGHITKHQARSRRAEIRKAASDWESEKRR